MKNALIIILVIIILAGAGWYFWSNRPGEPRTPVSKVNSFEECLKQGGPVMESYPRQCRSQDGKTFVEDIGNALAKQDSVRLTKPRPNDIVRSPLIIEGEARGNWYFEGSFPVTLLDGRGKIIARGPAQAQEEWMTTDFVPFKIGLKFDLPETETGFLVLEKDNPSGLPENADELRIPVKFR